MLLNRHISDCNMPVMNGYDLTRAIRAHELENGQTPCSVLGFTANAQPEEKQRCREAGMDDCLFKPISLTALNERLSHIPIKPPNKDYRVPSSPFEMDSILALTGDRPEMIEHLITQLISSCRDDAQELDEVICRGNRQEIHDIAHKIKGAARIISANEVIELCTQLEQGCDSGVSTQIIEQGALALKAAMRTLEQALLHNRR